MLSFKRKLIFCITALILLFLAAEIGLRGYYSIKRIAKAKQDVELDKYLGWKCPENTHYKITKKGYAEGMFSSGKYGFRVFGDVLTPKTKILVIGDSNTQASTVSDGQTYYDYLKQANSDIEIFAYGCGGYGTLQEYMILDKYYDLIRPDIVLWQFCGNDIFNNLFELESASFRNNNHRLRPYYQDSKIVWLYPHSNWFYRNMLRHSYVIKLLHIPVEMLLADNPGPLSPELQSPENPLYQKSIKVTSQVVGLVKKRVGNTPIVAFCLGGQETFTQICREYNIKVIPGIAKALQKAQRAEIKIDGAPYDPHFNNLGHKIFGEVILSYLIENRFLNDTKTKLADKHVQ